MPEASYKTAASDLALSCSDSGAKHLGRIANNKDPDQMQH